MGFHTLHFSRVLLVFRIPLGLVGSSWGRLGRLWTSIWELLGRSAAASGVSGHPLGASGRLWCASGRLGGGLVGDTWCHLAATCASPGVVGAFRCLLVRLSWVPSGAVWVLLGRLVCAFWVSLTNILKNRS